MNKCEWEISPEDLRSNLEKPPFGKPSWPNGIPYLDPPEVFTKEMGGDGWTIEYRTEKKNKRGNSITVWRGMQPVIHIDEEVPHPGRPGYHDYYSIIRCKKRDEQEYPMRLIEAKTIADRLANNELVRRIIQDI